MNSKFSVDNVEMDWGSRKKYFNPYNYTGKYRERLHGDEEIPLLYREVEKEIRKWFYGGR